MSKKLLVAGNSFDILTVSSFDVDAENCFTPLCPLELPVPEGDKIVGELNEQATYTTFRIGSKDCHSMASLWVDTDKHPQFEPIKGYENLDVRWNVHGVPGTPGFRLIDGLPNVTEYDYFIWKGQELDMHPYGACFHDLHQKMSTGVIEWAELKGIKVVIVGGLATDYCVKITVLQLLSAGFTVILNLAACRGIAPDTTEAAIEEMKAQGAIIINNAKALSIEE